MTPTSMTAKIILFEGEFALRNIKLGKKIGLAFGLILLLTAGSGMFSVREANTVGEYFIFVTDDLHKALFDAMNTIDGENSAFYAITIYRFNEESEMLKPKFPEKYSIQNLSDGI